MLFISAAVVFENKERVGTRRELIVPSLNSDQLSGGDEARKCISDETKKNVTKTKSFSRDFLLVAELMKNQRLRECTPSVFLGPPPLWGFRFLCYCESACVEKHYSSLARLSSFHTHARSTAAHPLFAAQTKKMRGTARARS